MNKCAREDTGFTWMISILIIVFILVMYLFLGVPGAYGSKKLGDDREMVLSEGSNRLIAIEKFIGFLGNEVEFDGENVLIKDLIEGDLESNNLEFEEFGRLSKDFLVNLVGEKDYLSSWIRIYEKDQEIGRDSKNSIYGVKANNVVCDPSWANTDVFFIVNQNKKIAFCFREVRT